MDKETLILVLVGVGLIVGAGALAGSYAIDKIANILLWGAVPITVAGIIFEFYQEMKKNKVAVAVGIAAAVILLVKFFAYPSYSLFLPKSAFSMTFHELRPKSGYDFAVPVNPIVAVVYNLVSPSSQVVASIFGLFQGLGTVLSMTSAVKMASVLAGLLVFIILSRSLSPVAGAIGFAILSLDPLWFIVTQTDEHMVIASMFLLALFHFARKYAIRPTHINLVIALSSMLAAAGSLEEFRLLAPILFVVLVKMEKGVLEIRDWLMGVILLAFGVAYIYPSLPQLYTSLVNDPSARFTIPAFLSRMASSLFKNILSLPSYLLGSSGIRKGSVVLALGALILYRREPTIRALFVALGIVAISLMVTRAFAMWDYGVMDEVLLVPILVTIEACFIYLLHRTRSKILWAVVIIWGIEFAVVSLAYHSAILADVEIGAISRPLAGKFSLYHVSSQKVLSNLPLNESCPAITYRYGPAWSILGAGKMYAVMSESDISLLKSISDEILNEYGCAYLVHNPFWQRLAYPTEKGSVNWTMMEFTEEMRQSIEGSNYEVLIDTKVYGKPLVVVGWKK